MTNFFISTKVNCMRLFSLKKTLLIILVLCFSLIISKPVSAVSLTNTISVSVYPALLAIDETTNKIYATSFPDAMSIQVIDGSTDTPLTTIPIDAGENAGLSSIAVNSNTGTVYVLKSTSFESRENKIFIIDDSSNMVTGEIVTEPYGLFGNIALDQAANRIYVTSNNSVSGSLNSVTVIDATSKTILHSLELMGSPGKMVVDSSKNRIYAINTIANEIFVLEFDTNSNKLSLIATINIEGGGGPQSIALIPTINKLFVDSLNTEFVYVINTNTNEITEKIPGRKKNDEVDSLGANSKTNKLYVAYEGSSFLKTSDEVVVYDASTLAIDDRIKLDFDSVEFFANQTTNKVYAAASINSTTPIYVLSDGSGPTSSGTISTSGGTTTSSGGEPVFVTGFKSDIKEMIEAVRDIKVLDEIKNAEKGARKSFIERADKIIKSLKDIKSGIRAPKLACQGILLSRIGQLDLLKSQLCASTLIKSGGPCSGQPVRPQEKQDEVLDRILTTFNEIKSIATIDDDKNDFSDLCEQRK